MKCRFFDKIEDFHEGNLNKKEQIEIREHLRSCTDCQEQLDRILIKSEMIAQLKSVKPGLENPPKFKNEILAMIDHNAPSRENIGILDLIRNLLLQPATRFAIVSAAVVIVGLFIYQHSILVKKMDELSNRLETKMEISERNQNINERFELLSKYRGNKLRNQDDIEELLDEFHQLQFRYEILVKSLKDQYPEVYEDLEELIDEPSVEIKSKEIKL